MLMPGRKYSANSKYRYGFNGKENDNEVKGDGNQQDYGFRIYDPRIAKFLSVDPLTKTYPYYTPYQFGSNSPIIAIDVDGLESSNDKNPSSAAGTEPPLPVPQSEGNWAKKNEYPFLGNTTISHRHGETIINAYENSGGDLNFTRVGGEQAIEKMNNNLQPVKPGSILQDSRSPKNVTNITQAFYSASEGGSEAAWVNVLLGGFISGKIPENIVFSENGTVSQYLEGGLAYKDFILQWYHDGQPANSKTIYTFSYQGMEQAMDLVGHQSFNSLSNFVGSSMATVLYNPDEKSIVMTITNVTSVASGDLGKHFWWHTDAAPTLYRDNSINIDQPFTNFSQTYRLKLSYEKVMEDIDNIRLGPIYY
ncbi:hypothetical protein EGI32_15875 [Ferruginibacter sp. HRS2-29]|nr:hypothetical protein [Ferruginibacter sp. HRS2-29]